MDFLPFLQLMFKQINARRPPQPAEYNLISVSSAVYTLQNCTGMTREYLGKRLGLTRTQMVNLESRGKPITLEILAKLERISLEYNLDALARYFDKQELLIQANRRTKLRETTGR